MMKCQFCGEEIATFDIAHSCREQHALQQVQKANYLGRSFMSDIPQSHILKAARNEERQKIIAFLEDEISRGKSLIGLQDHKGQPFYSDEAMTIGIEVLKYCIAHIKEME